jgi:hypothetical protein
MNHADDCDRSDTYLSGRGYNRVRVCACGAEDHEPEFSDGWGRDTTSLMAPAHVEGNPS